MVFYPLMGFIDTLRNRIQSPVRIISGARRRRLSEIVRSSVFQPPVFERVSCLILGTSIFHPRGRRWDPQTRKAPPKFDPQLPQFHPWSVDPHPHPHPHPFGVPRRYFESGPHGYAMLCYAIYDRDRWVWGCFRRTTRDRGQGTGRGRW